MSGNNDSYVFLIYIAEDIAKVKPYLNDLIRDGCNIRMGSGSGDLSAKEQTDLLSAAVCIMFLSEKALRKLPLEQILEKAENRDIRWIVVYLEELVLTEGQRLMQGYIQAIPAERKDASWKLRSALPDYVFHGGINPIRTESAPSGRKSNVRYRKKTLLVFGIVFVAASASGTFYYLQEAPRVQEENISVIASVEEAVQENENSMIASVEEAVQENENSMIASVEEAVQEDENSMIASVEEAVQEYENSDVEEEEEAAPFIEAGAGEDYARILEKYLNAYHELKRQSPGDYDDYKNVVLEFPEDINRDPLSWRVDELLFSIVNTGETGSSGILILGKLDESRVNMLDLMLFSDKGVQQYVSEIEKSEEDIYNHFSVFCNEDTLLVRDQLSDYSTYQMKIYDLKEGNLVEKDVLLNHGGEYYRGIDYHVLDEDVTLQKYEEYLITADEYHKIVGTNTPIQLKTYVLDDKNIEAVRQCLPDALSDSTVYTQDGALWMR